MEEYRKDKAIQQVRAMLSLLNVSEENLDKFDGLCRDFDLTIEEVTDWKDLENSFTNPQTFCRD